MPLLTFRTVVPIFAESPALLPNVAEGNLYVAPARMKEWNDWRFGLFIHWGPWSQSRIGYIWKIVRDDSPEARERMFNLNRTFDPADFQPKEWARAAKNAGMKYVVFVVKHHDGFNNYDTALSDYKITASDCPYSVRTEPDVTRAVINAFRAEGLHIGLYYSHIDWHHPDGRFFSKGYWNANPELVDRDPAAWQRFVAYEKGQLRELLTNYGKIDIIWFDIFWPFATHGRQTIANPRVRKDVLEMLAMMKQLQPDIIFDDRGTDVFGGFATLEQNIPSSKVSGSWESCITITNGTGFWYKGDDVSTKSPAELVHMLVEVASKGGNLLLSVGPSPEGRLIPGEVVGLAGVGAWMKVNHESIYETTAGVLLPQTWGFSTAKGTILYLEVFDWPADGQLEIRGLHTSIKRAYALADPQRASIPVRDASDGTTLLVSRQPLDLICSVIVLELAGPP